jgi:hypothetical protein
MTDLANVYRPTPSARCRHPGHRLSGGSAFDPDRPAFACHWIGCGDCGEVWHRDNWRFRPATKKELAADRVRFLRDCDPHTVAWLVWTGRATEAEADKAGWELFPVETQVPA